MRVKAFAAVGRITPLGETFLAYQFGIRILYDTPIFVNFPVDYSLLIPWAL